MEPKATPRSRRKMSRRYQARPSKHKINVSRYKARGITQRSGTAAMFWEMWWVKASKSAEPHAARLTHRACTFQGGGGAPWRLPPRGAGREDESAATAHKRATAAYAHDHPNA